MARESISCRKYGHARAMSQGANDPNPPPPHPDPTARAEIARARHYGLALAARRQEIFQTENVQLERTPGSR
eukprot:7796231-Karenia_brevis.AAC.1